MLGMVIATECFKALQIALLALYSSTEYSVIFLADKI
jgi:hypothetical protein